MHCNKGLGCEWWTMFAFYLRPLWYCEGLYAKQFNVMVNLWGQPVVLNLYKTSTMLLTRWCCDLAEGPTEFSCSCTRLKSYILSTGFRLVARFDVYSICNRISIEYLLQSFACFCHLWLWNTVSHIWSLAFAKQLRVSFLMLALIVLGPCISDRCLLSILSKVWTNGDTLLPYLFLCHTVLSQH